MKKLMILTLMMVIHTVEGCVFDGKILTIGTTEETKTTGGAGIVGWTNGQSLTIKNCLYKPATLEDGETPVACSTIYGEYGGTITCTDCYYTAMLGTAQGTQAYTVSSGTSGLTLDFGSASSTYEYNGVKVYSFGLSYNGQLYSGSGQSVTFTPQADKEITSLKANGETLTANNDDTYTLTMPAENVTITAVIDPYEIELQDALSNTATIDENHGNIADVTITGRTLYKDGNWNTLCLPFDVTAEQIAISDHPLYGCTIMELDTEGEYDGHHTGFDSEHGTLYLYFKNATAIEAGVPYLIKWASGDNIVNPEFPYSEIEGHDPEAIESSDHKVNFVGNFDPVTLTAGAGTYYLGTGNKLYYPSTGRTMNAFRAYFTVDLGSSSAPQQVRSFVMNIGGEETTGVVEMRNEENVEMRNDAWYDLQGRKVANGQWSMVHGQLKKGIYIHNGKKRVIK